MIINYPQQKYTPLIIRSNEINTPQAPIELLIQKVGDENREKRFVNNKVKYLLSLYNINEHDNNLVYYFTEGEPNIKNNKEAIASWVKAELAGGDIEVLSMRFKNLLSRIDPTVDLSEF